MNGAPLRLQTVPAADAEEMQTKGVVPVPRPAARASRCSQPGNVLRIFERGGRFRPEIGIPEREEEPGRPADPPERPRPRHREPHRPGAASASTRPACSTRRSTSWAPTTTPATTAPAAAPPATSSTPTTARRVHSGPYAKYGNRGTTRRHPDPTIPKDEPGHPIDHRFTQRASRPASAWSATSTPAPRS